MAVYDKFRVFGENTVTRLAFMAAPYALQITSYLVMIPAGSPTKPDGVEGACHAGRGILTDSSKKDKPFFHPIASETRTVRRENDQETLQRPINPSPMHSEIHQSTFVEEISPIRTPDEDQDRPSLV